ncbi:MAG: ABC transporter permease subunit [Prolixibacteraceae bacterium]
MIRLLKIELNKIIYNRTIWVILGLYIVLFAPVAFGFDNILKSFSAANARHQQSGMADLIQQGYSVFNFPGVWHNLAYLASWFKLLLALIIITIVTNEYTYKTLRQNIIDGLSKWEIIWAKELVILVFSIVAVILLVILTLILGNSQSNVSMFTGSSILFVYFFTLILYFNLAYFLSSWLKKSGFVFGILILYTVIIENVAAAKLSANIARFLPMHLIGYMIPNPMSKLVGQNPESDFSILNIGIGVFYIALFIALNFLLLKKGHAGKQ